MNILVAFYSHSENTAVVADAIAQKVNGDLFRIEPVQPYPRTYREVVVQAKKEIRENHRPTLARDVDLSPYDAVFVGTPNWWSTVAPPVAAFLSGHRFTDMRVFPFLTHGGGGEARIPADIARLCAGTSVSKPLSIYGGENRALDEKIDSWLREIKFGL